MFALYIPTLLLQPWALQVKKSRVIRISTPSHLYPFRYFALYHSHVYHSRLLLLTFPSLNCHLWPWGWVRPSPGTCKGRRNFILASAIWQRPGPAHDAPESAFGHFFSLPFPHSACRDILQQKLSCRLVVTSPFSAPAGLLWWISRAAKILES